MEVKIVFKDYGRGKKRIILVNVSDSNRAFISFGEKDTPYKYLYEQFNKQKK